MTHKIRAMVISWVMVAGLLFSGTFAHADTAQLMSVIDGLKKQMGEMQKVIEQQNTKISTIEKRQPAVDISKAPAVAGEPTPPMSDAEFGDRLNGALGGAQKWLKDLKFGGDLRLRYEAFANRGTSSNHDRNRFRYRLRYGFEKKISDEIKVGFRMASGEAVTNNGHNADPTSTNQTFGNLFNYKNIWVDRAFASYIPKWAKIGPVSSVEFTGGKFKNPFEAGSSDIVWDRDVTPEGAYQQIKFDLLRTPEVRLKGYATAGQFVLQESSSAGKDIQMFGYQLGLNPSISTPMFERPVDIKAAMSYYDYGKYGVQTSFRIDQNSTGTSMRRGNSQCSSTELCTRFNVLDYYGSIKMYPFGGSDIPLEPFGTMVYNTKSGQSMRDRHAWSIGAKVGKNKEKGDWEVGYAYKYIGADSVPGVFSDSDFGYDGHVGKKGHQLKLGYQLGKNLSLNGTAYYVRNLNIGQALDATSSSRVKSQEQFRFQLDTSFKF